MTNQRWKLVIEYDGTDFCGWQIQGPDVVTVQQVIEDALYKFCQQQIRIHAAGRTDAGVHARGQVVHFDLDYGDRDLTPYDLAKAINALIGEHKVAILSAEKIHDTFHARFDALSKTYLYRVLKRRAPPVMDVNKVWHIYGDLDVVGMQEAAQFLIGYHDFSSFRAQDCQAKHPMRSIDRADVMINGDYIDFIFEGRSFLHHQVRNMVGSLMMVGQRKWSPLKIYEVLMAKDRAVAGPTAPPEGLSLEHIFYPNQ
jgi:tRNA pseudouridine38-40 synthase